MPPKRTSKGKEKIATTSGTARTQTPEGGVRRFLGPGVRIRYTDVVSHWQLHAERPVKLEDFPGFELCTLVRNCGWEKLVARPHPVYDGLVREFYANFNMDIDTPGSEHLHQTWVRGKWILFTPEVIQDFYQLTWDHIVPIPEDFPWPEVATVLLGRDNAWPLDTEEWHQIELTPSVALLWLFICYNIEPTQHRSTFQDPKAGLLFHLVRGHKIDLATLLYEQIHTLGISGDRRNSLIFPSLISGICKRAGVPIPPGELPVKTGSFIKRSSLEAQNRARARHQDIQRRAIQGQQAAPAQDVGVDDMDMPPAAPAPPHIGVDTQILRQVFAITTGYGRDLQSLQQAFGTMRTDVQQVRADTLTTRTLASDTSRETIATREALENMTGRLSLYAGRVDDIQLRADATVDRLGHLEAEIQRQSVILHEQSEMMRQILARLPPLPDVGPSFPPPPSSPPPF